MALLIVTDTYLDGRFRALRAPQHDATALAAVLGGPAIGGFTVETVINRTADEVKRRVYRLFKEAPARTWCCAMSPATASRTISAGCTW